MDTKHFIVVVGIDFSDAGDHALDKALELAATRDGGEVHVVHVEQERLGGAEHFARDQTNVDATLRQIGKHVTDRMKAMGQRFGQPQRVVAYFRHGSPGERIMQLASDLDADLVVVGSNGHRGFGLFLGSVAEQVARLSSCPVCIVHPKARSPAVRPSLVEPTGPRTGAADRRPHYTFASNGICAATATLHDAAHAP